MLSLRCLLLSILALSGCCTPGPSEGSPPTTVAPVPSAVPAPHDVSETAGDRVVTDRIRALFREDYEIATVEGDVAIATRQGVVTLTGRVHTDRQRVVMAGHARATDDVTSVEDDITLAP
jgi:osmotically-inducible protein OsmY